MTTPSRPNELASSADFEFAALNGASNYRNALLADFGEHLRGRVLEVGAGIGQITGALLQNPAIDKLLSVEPEPRFCARLRTAFPAHTIVEGTIRDVPADELWDAVLCVNVLEHIQEDERELAAYHKALVPARGVLCLFVPARPEIYAPLDRDFGHFRRYTLGELRGKLERAGFTILRLHYFNFIGYFAWWWTFCLFKRRTFNAAAVRFFDRVIFPPMHTLERRLCPPPLGQSLLATAQAA